STRLAGRGIAEVAQNGRSQAAGTVRVRHHAPELLVLDFLAPGDLRRIDGHLRPAGGTVTLAVDEKFARLHVGIGPQERRDGGAAVSAGAANFLVVRFERAGN